MPVRPRNQPGAKTELVLSHPSPQPKIATDSADICDWRDLLHQRWLDIGHISCLNMPRVKGTILEGLTELMKADPSPEFGRAVPFYVPQPDRFDRLMLQESVYA